MGNYIYNHIVYNSLYRYPKSPPLQEKVTFSPAASTPLISENEKLSAQGAGSPQSPAERKLIWRKLMRSTEPISKVFKGTCDLWQIVFFLGGGHKLHTSSLFIILIFLDLLRFLSDCHLASQY